MSESLAAVACPHLHQAAAAQPKVIRLAIDTTCDEAFGYQQMTFYNGFYKCSCYVPLFIFTENGFPLASLLRPGNAGKYDDTVRMLRPVVDELRKHWARYPHRADRRFRLRCSRYLQLLRAQSNHLLHRNSRKLRTSVSQRRARERNKGSLRCCLGHNRAAWEIRQVRC
ncbi:MAG: transposase [Candidatus Melainabacteria bacterium]|nr:transposase [Candidatus Melainabacteria bacterium]